MARPRIPSKVLEARGAFKKNPNRKRPNEPVPKGDVGRVPVHLNEGQKTCWREIVKQAPPGVLKNSDRVMLEIASVLFSDFRTSGSEFQAAKLTRLEAMLGRFGMSPSDRSKMVVVKPKEHDPWDDL